MEVLVRIVVIFDADMSSSIHDDNNKKYNLILGKVSTQALDDAALIADAEAEYFIDFTDQGNKLCLSLHYNWSNSYFFLNGVKINQFKATDSDLNDYPLCFRNILQYFLDDNMKQTGLNVYVYDFLFDYGSIDVDDILDIHEELMNEN